jgi:hypothetical protein
MNYLLLKLLFGIYLLSFPLLHDVPSTISKREFNQISLIKHSPELLFSYFDVESVFELTTSTKEFFLKSYNKYKSYVSIDRKNNVSLRYFIISKSLLISFPKTSIIYPFNSFL